MYCWFVDCQKPSDLGVCDAGQNAVKVRGMSETIRTSIKLMIAADKNLIVTFCAPFDLFQCGT